MKHHTITQKDRWGYITPIPEGVMKINIANKLSYIKKNSKFMANPIWGHVCLYDKVKGRFPIGLLNIVINMMDVVHLNITRSTQDIIHTHETLRHYQINALNTMLNNTVGILKMPTGSGKTKVAVEYLKMRDVPTLVLVPTLDLVEQWNKQVPKNVHVKTYASINKKSYVQQFDIVIFDECHHVAAKTLYRIGMNVKESAELFGLSATPLDRDDDNMKVTAVIGPIIYEIPIKELIEYGYLVPAKVYYHKVPHESYEFMTYPEVYQQYVVENYLRNGLIVKLARNCPKPCLILVGRIEHGDKLLEYLSDEDAIFLNGQIGKSARYNTNHDIIIATGIYDEGVDLPDLKTLILASGGLSAIKACQRIGRVLRPAEGKSEAIVHDFKDDCKWLRKHYLERRSIFERDFEVIDD
jgi:superfamily II DNA or RNA helicase